MTMIEAPVSFAATPPARAEHDVLGEILRTLRLTGSVFLNGRFSAPFGVTSPRQFDGATPFADLRHVSVFHLISAGSCTIQLASGEQHAVGAGDILLMPFADEHRLWSHQSAEMTPAQTLVREGTVPGMWTIDHGGGGEETRMVCGFIESAEFLQTPVFRSLPPLIVERTADSEVSAVITSTLRDIVRLTELSAPGSELVLGRLMEVLFVEVVRRYAMRLPAGAKGLFAAINDPLVSRAIGLVHREPARRWTVEDLARGAGTSRTVLAERFHAMLGQAPIEYVTGWRMQLAADRIRNSRASLAAIAADVGYESEAAFNRAFRRVTGTTPGRWRDAAKAGTS